MDDWTEKTTEADRIRVFHGDSRAVLKAFPDDHFDSVVCDPPYALVSIVKRFGGANAAAAQVGASGAYARASAGFMGKTWDTGETAFAVEFWAEVWRVLKPGGHVIAFSGTRTYHRLACAVEDAGFEIRDMVAWLYGSGFPKSHDVSKGIDKAAGVEGGKGEMKRGGERLLRQAPDGARDGDGTWGNEVGRSAYAYAPGSAAARQWSGWGTALKPALEPVVLARKPLQGTVAANVLAHGTGALNIDASRIAGEKTPAPVGQFRGSDVGATGLRGVRDGSADNLGRWPANVCHDGSEEVVGAFPETASGFMKAGTARKGERAVFGQDVACGDAVRSDTPGDSGSAARFFYSAKADAEDRLGSKHPTVKPVDLMAYLVRLVTPPGGLTLDPFAGSGTTGVGAMRGGFGAVLIEREDDYVSDIMRKLAWARGEGRLTTLELAKLDTPEKHAAAAGADLPLFG